MHRPCRSQTTPAGRRCCARTPWADCHRAWSDWTVDHSRTSRSLRTKTGWLQSVRCAESTPEPFRDGLLQSTAAYRAVSRDQMVPAASSHVRYCAANRTGALGAPNPR
ncbi:MAG: hypothetical protein DI613_21235 [Kocuria rhizophila]|nr:MAG: hypothetical protein DI613_21235 [Kocuria rhizophila]